MNRFLTNPNQPSADQGCSPLVDLYETAEELVFEIELPGVEPSDIGIQVVEHFLIMEGKCPVVSGRKGTFLCMERQRKSFRRILNIPIAVDVTKGSATYRNGVITVRFPKLKGKWIAISIEQK